MHKLSFGVVGVVFGVVVGGGGIAVAATGGSFLLGKSNAANHATSLKSTGSGATLSLLASRAGQPPLSVSANSGKATNLNADKLDGLDSSALARVAGRTGAVGANAVWLDADKDGTNDTLVADATCPSGSTLTGGGEEDFSTGGTIWSEPVGGNTWEVAAIADPTKDQPTDVAAVAICYNPTGAVAGAQSTRVASARTASSTRMAKLAAVAARSH